MTDVRAIAPVPDIVPDALPAYRVGTWEHDVSSDRMWGDALAAELFEADAGLAQAGLPSSEFLAAIHPDDNLRVDPHRAVVRTRGGVLVFELRVMAFGVVSRWLLVHGSYHRDATGLMHGRGIVIDVSASKLDGAFDKPLLFTAPPEEPASSLNEAVDHVLAAHKAIEAIEEPARRPLLQTVRLLLYFLGSALVKGTPDG